MKCIPRSFFSLISKGLKNINSNQGKVDYVYKMKAFAYGSQFEYSKAHESWREIFNKNEITKLLESSKEKMLSNYWNDVKDCHYLDQASYVDIKTWLPNDILFKVDRMSMANSQETRAPILDYNLVEFAASLPIEFKMKMLRSKYILKKFLMKKFNLKFGKKLGFNAPAGGWINRHYDNFYNYLISSKLWNPDMINNLLTDHAKFKIDNSYKIFNLFGYTNWHNNIKKIKKISSYL